MSTTYDVKQLTGWATATVTCWCSMRFAIPQQLYDFYCRQNGDRLGSFELCCPLGHKFVPQGKSEADKLRDQLAREKHWREQTDARNSELRRLVETRDRQVSARKAVATKLRKRIASGKCPCCHAKFPDLKRHMRTDHPDWSPEKAAEAMAEKSR